MDGRGYYGTAYVGLNSASITRPAISQYGVLAGPTYRFYMRPRYSLAGAGDGRGGVRQLLRATPAALARFRPSGNGYLLYPDSTTYAISGAMLGEANVSPNFSLRLGPEYYATGFGSSLQNSLGFTYGFVFRFGKQ